MILIKILLILTLCAIAYQDIKNRMIYLFLFPLCAILFGVLSFDALGLTFFTSHLPYNVLFILAVLFIIGVYFRLKYDSAFAKAALGQGDYLMFFATCFAMGFSAFLIFSVSSVIAALVIAIMLKWLRGNDVTLNQIPLAGYMAIFFGILFSVQWSGGITSFYN